LRHSKHLR